MVKQLKYKKMKRLFILSFIFFLSFSIYSQPQLKWFNPSPDGITHNSIWFEDSGHAWAVGDFGKILFWDGHNWMRQDSKTNEKLQSVCFTDAYHGWAVGSNGCILRFANNEWIDQSINTNVNLSCIVISGDGDGWICGDTILRLQNNEWTVFPGQETLQFSEMSFTSTNDGWAVNKDQDLYHFNGISWSEETNSNIIGALGHLSFSDPDHGIMSSLEMDGDVLYHYDHGNVYQAIPTANIQSIYMFDSLSGYAVGCGGWFFMGDGKSRIYKLDKGTWSVDTIVETPLFSIHGNNDMVWATGASGNIYLKQNEKWQLINGYTDHSINYMSFPDSIHGWMASYQGHVLKYERGWLETDTVFDGHKLYGLYFTDSISGYALTNKNASSPGCMILKYMNKTWISQLVNSTDYPVALSVIDSEHLWIACYKDMYFSNGFAWWKYETGLIPTQHHEGLCMVNPNLGFAVGYSSQDSSFLSKFDGNSWNIIKQNLPPHIKRIGAFNDQNCWMSDSYGKIWKYDFLSDVLTEEVLQQNTYFENCEIQMISDTEGYVSNMNGIMRYDGSTWAYIDEMKLYTPLSFDFTHNNYKWVGGYYGLLLSDYALSPLSYPQQLKPCKISALAYPNPVTEGTVIEYEISEETNAKVEIADAFGRSIFSFTVHNQQVGTNKFFLPQPLPSPGIYFCRIIIGTKIEIVKLVKY